MIKRKSGNAKVRPEKRERRIAFLLSFMYSRGDRKFFFIDDREEEQIRPRFDSPRFDIVEETNSGDGSQIHKRPSRKPLVMANHYEKQETAR